MTSIIDNDLLRDLIRIAQCYGNQLGSRRQTRAVVDALQDVNRILAEAAACLPQEQETTP